VLIAPLQPAVLACAGAAQFWYTRQARLARNSTGWPLPRTVLFATGLVAVLAVTSGPVERAARASFSVWVIQALLLLLVVPLPLVAGQPLELARRVSSRLGGFTESPVGRFCGSPVVGAALIPLACVAFLFGPLPGLAISTDLVGWPVQVAMLLIGVVIVLPLVGAEVQLSSLAVGVALAIGAVELLLDAVPGMVMRLSTHPVSNFFSMRSAVSGQRSWLGDQQFAGGVLWCVAELIDLPFLILIFRRWLAADAREAAAADAREADTADAREAAAADAREADTDDARAAATSDGTFGSAPGAGPAGATQEAGRPWFLDDPRLRDRFR
jgi:cytochrome c oxidase assembly factor CtaG